MAGIWEKCLFEGCVNSVLIWSSVKTDHACLSIREAVDDPVFSNKGSNIIALWA